MFNDSTKVRRKGFNERLRQEQLRKTRRQRGLQCYSWFCSKGWKWTLVLLLTGLSVWQGWYWLRRLNPGQILTLKEVEIRGNQLMSWDEVLQICGVEIGVPMGMLATDSIEKRLEREPRVQSVQVSRSFPSTLVIEIEEAKALYLMQTTKGWKVYSQRGDELPILANAAMSLPIVTTETQKERLVAGEFLNELLNSDSLLYTKVSQVVPRSKGIEVYFRNADYKTLFSANSGRQKVFHHYRLLTQGTTVSLAGVKIVDMRFHGFAYTIPYQKGRDDG